MRRPLSAVPLAATAFEERFGLAVRQMNVREQDRRRRRCDSETFTEEGMNRIAVQGVEAVHQTEVLGRERQRLAGGGKDQFKVPRSALTLEPVEEPAVTQNFGIAFPDGDDRAFRKPGSEPSSGPAGAIP